MKTYTDEEKKEKTQLIRAAIKTGVPVYKACKDHGIAAATYQYWTKPKIKAAKKKQVYWSRRPKKVEHITVQAATLSPPTSRFVFVMDVDTALEFARRQNG